jgi:restriction system protein
VNEPATGIVPSQVALMWPTLRAIRELGGSATIQEITEKVVEIEDLSEEQQSVPHGEGPRSELEYRLAWARTYLKNIGTLENSARGVWSVTESGRSTSEADIGQLVREWLANRTAAAQLNDRREDLVGEGDPELETSESWKDLLLSRLLELAPDAFERLSKRLLREAGFSNVTVTGRSGDGGIDGVGVYRVSLISFQIFLQCKRYRGSVGASHVRDFRGAMTGRGDKGLLLTTGTFTADAKAEATRDGAPPIDLVDGDQLCQLLRDYSLGVTVKTREVADITVDESFFDDV